MKEQITKTSLSILILALSCPTLHANEMRSLLIRKSHSLKKKASPFVVLERPKDQESSDQFYIDFFAQLDPQIERMYSDRFWYHETQVNYGLPRWRHEIIGFASVETFGRGPFEGDVRNDLAKQVLRMRIDTGIRAALHKIKNPMLATATQQIQSAVNKVKDFPIQLSDKPGNKAGEFRFGYDFISDHSKVEYLRGIIEAGLYHSEFSGLVTGQKSFEETRLNLSTNLGKTIPKTTLILPLHQRTVGATLSKALSDTVDASVRSEQPLRDPSQAHSYFAEIAYRF